MTGVLTAAVWIAVVFGVIAVGVWIFGTDRDWD